MDKKPHFYHLDTLRAMAALLVMLCHARCVTLGYYPELVPESQGALVQLFYLVCSQGAWAVATFFVLSGFLVGGKTVERIQRGQISARKYALDRMFRIGVPLFGATVLIVVTNLIVGDPIEPWQLLGQFAGLQGVLVGDAGGVFWTLAYEIWFYFLLLGVILFVSSRRYVMGGVLLVVSLGVIGMLEPSWFFAIVAGVVAYFFRQRCLAKKSVMALFALAAIGFVMYYCAHSSGTARFACLDDKFAPFYLVAFAGMMALGISQIVSHEPKGRVLKLINNSGGVIAKFSYSLYLTHYQVLKLHIHFGTVYHELTPYTWGYFFALCGACMALAYLFYWIFERNTSRIQSWVCTRLHL